MKKLNTQSGFTLIELVVVIVILGILAATAAPKFIDLTGDARISVMKGVQGSIQSAVSLAHSKALIAGETGATGDILIGGLHYALVNGYPAAIALGDNDGSSIANGFGIENFVEIDDDDITVAAVDADTTSFTHTGGADDATCVIEYTDAADSETPPNVDDDDLTAC